MESKYSSKYDEGNPTSDNSNNLIMSFQNGKAMVGYHYIDNSNNGAFISGGKNQQLLL